MSNGLGRGLSSLIPQKSNKDDDYKFNDLDNDLDSNTKDRVLKVDIDKITINPMQPRSQFSDHNIDELVESIREYGIIQPLIASKTGDTFELIAGERRLRAAKKLGLENVPVIIRDVQSQERLEVALIENIQRENLNAIELATAYLRLIDEFNLTQEEVAKRVSKSRSAVANSLRLLNLPQEIKDAVIQGKISEGHAKFLIGLDSEEKQMNLFRKILRNNLSVHDTNKEARRMGGTKQARIKINYEDQDKELTLREFFGTKVEIKRKGKGGQIVVDFFSDDELGEIVDKVKN